MGQVWAAVGFGFLASFHCIFMCGPLALAIPVGGLPQVAKILGRFSFVAGRLLIYSLMGAMVGGLGKPISWLGLQEFWLWISAILLFSVVSVWDRKYFSSFRKRLQFLSRQLIMEHPFSGFAILGMANGLLPCGMVYGALALAMVSGSAWMGAFTMLLFGIGTSWWHLVLILEIRIPSFKTNRISFLSSAKMAMVMVVLALIFRIIDHTLPDRHHDNINSIFPKEKIICQKPA